MATTTGDIESTVDLIGDGTALPMEGDVSGLHSSSARAIGSVAGRPWASVDEGGVHISDARGMGEQFEPLSHYSGVEYGYLPPWNPLLPNHFVIQLRHREGPERDLVLFASRTGIGLVRKWRRAAALVREAQSRYARLMPRAEAEPSIPAAPHQVPPSREVRGEVIDESGKYGPITCFIDEGVASFRTSLAGFEGGRMSKWHMIVAALTGLFALAAGALLDSVGVLVGLAVIAVGVLIQGFVLARLTCYTELAADGKTVTLTRNRGRRILFAWECPVEEVRRVQAMHIAAEAWGVFVGNDDDEVLFGADGRLKREHAELVRNALLERHAATRQVQARKAQL
jgi:hypothetical protein